MKNFDFTNIKSQQLFQFLLHDVLEVKDLLKKNDSQLMRRTYVRTFFAFIEGTLFELKEDMLLSFYPLSDEEKFSLFKKQLPDDMQNTGNLNPLRVSIKENLEKTFSIFASLHNANYKLKKNTKGWNSFVQAISIRNHLTHPTNYNRLVVSDKNVIILDMAFEWFLLNYNRLMKCTLDSIDSHIKLMRRAISKQKNKKLEGLKKDYYQLQLIWNEP